MQWKDHWYNGFHESYKHEHIKPRRAGFVFWNMTQQLPSLHAETVARLYHTISLKGINNHNIDQVMPE